MAGGAFLLDDDGRRVLSDDGAVMLTNEDNECPDCCGGCPLCRPSSVDLVLSGITNCPCQLHPGGAHGGWGMFTNLNGIYTGTPVAFTGGEDRCTWNFVIPVEYYAGNDPGACVTKTPFNMTVTAEYVVATKTWNVFSAIGALPAFRTVLFITALVMQRLTALRRARRVLRRTRSSA